MIQSFKDKETQKIFERIRSRKLSSDIQQVALMNLSQNQLALALRVPTRRINEIVHGKRRITADTALRSSVEVRSHFLNPSS